jgi:ubiquinone/menaquinone biosynthesis C-methylase UbiE
MIKNLKSYLRQRLKNSVFDYREIMTDFTFFPYKKGAQNFVLPLAAPAAEVGEDGLAVPPQDLWIGYGKTKDEYLGSGKKDVETMLELLEKTDFALSSETRLLDFGCGAGRMLRNLKNAGEAWGTDLSADHIYWCKQHLSPPFKFATTTSMPHLPFEDRYFDLIYCGSVFTHIDDLTEAWLLELRRILTVGGRIFLTIHDHHTMELLETDYKDSFLAGKMRANEFYMNADRAFQMLSIGRDTNSQVFYDREYFRKLLSQFFEVLTIVPEAYNYQTGIIITKK